MEKTDKKKYSLIAFDAYGTLFDVYSIGTLAESIFPGYGNTLSQLWRERQIEYTRLISLSDPNPEGSKYYLNFWEITQRSLRYVCKRLHLALSADSEEQLMAQYAKLTAFDDSLTVLKQIKEFDIATAILSNGNAEMLATVVQSNGLKPYLDRIVTVDPMRIFKTAPTVYGLLEQEFKVNKEEILFVSSNAWDALAAKWYGFDVFWVNRYNHPFEEIGQLPDFEGINLSAVLDCIEDRY